MHKQLSGCFSKLRCGCAGVKVKNETKKKGKEREKDGEMAVEDGLFLHVPVVRPRAPVAGTFEQAAEKEDTRSNKKARSAPHHSKAEPKQRHV